jgi:hypothetical protein
MQLLIMDQTPPCRPYHEADLHLMDGTPLHLAGHLLEAAELHMAQSHQT